MLNHFRIPIHGLFSEGVQVLVLANLSPLIETDEVLTCRHLVSLFRTEFESGSVSES